MDGRSKPDEEGKLYALADSVAETAPVSVGAAVVVGGRGGQPPRGGPPLGVWATGIEVVLVVSVVVLVLVVLGVLVVVVRVFEVECVFEEEEEWL